MLDHHWLGPSGDVNELSNDDLNAAVAVITGVRLNCFAPATIQQCLRGCHASLLRHAVSGDPCQRLNAQFRVGPRQ